MVAYSFKPRFVAPILAGTKTQTIRAPRKRHARPGEALQLYTGMRTDKCKLIRVAQCIRASVIIVDFKAEVVVAGYELCIPDGYNRELDHFARKDGFKNWHDMRAFWRDEHGDIDRFEGVLIRWAP